MIIDQEEFDRSIKELHQQARRDNLKRVIQQLGANLKPINAKEYAAARQARIQNDPATRKNYLEKLKLEEILDNLDDIIQADAEKFGYTSAFNWMLDLALSQPQKLNETPREHSQTPKRRQRRFELPKYHSLDSRIAHYAYPTLLGQIADGSLPVINRHGEDCRYAFIAQAPDEIELPDLRKPHIADTLHSSEFYEQFEVLKHFYIPFDDNSDQTEITTTHKPTGITPEKKEAKREATRLAKQHWDAEAAKGNYLRLYQMEEWLEKALIEHGYEDELPDSTDSLRDWIKDIKPAYASVRGRPRKIL